MTLNPFSQVVAGQRKFDLETARRLVTELADLIRPACERLEVAGSIRRGTPYVKDAELIATPFTDGNPNNLHAILDSLVERGIVEKALYGEQHTTRWGQKYRGMLFLTVYGHMKVELFLGNETSWGFLKWLRTGPGEANQYIMSYLIYRRAPLRFIDGDGWYSPGNRWHKPKDKWVADDKVQLCIPDEETLFALLGMPYIPPGERSEARYKQLLEWNRGHQWPDYSAFVLKALVQLRMSFAGDAQLDRENRHLRDPSRPPAISPFSVTAANAAQWSKQVYSECIQRAESALAKCRLEGQQYPSYTRRAEQLERELVLLRGMK